MKPSFGKDFTTGSIPRHLVRFALPILIGNLLATGYSIINAIWVGKLLGKDAVGAVAVSFPIFLGTVALCSGATLASSILVAKAYGAKDHAVIQRVVNHSWSIALILILTVTAGGYLLSDSLIRLMGTPEEIQSLAAGYLRISFVGFAGLYLSYLVSSVLRGVGDTVVPLLFVILSTVVNAVLDPVLIMGLAGLPELGLNGAALASLIATVLTTVMGILYVKRKYKGEPIHPTRLEFDGKAVAEILKLGLPSFVQQMLLSMGYAFITVFVNGYGAAAIAAFGVASRLDSIVAMPAIAMMMAASTLTAQNLGAGKGERIKDVLKWGIVINIPVIVVVSAVCVSFPEAVMRIFVREQDVISSGVDYLRIVGAGYLFFIFFYVSNGIINGAGKTVSTLIISFISLCVIRIPLAALLSHTSLGLRGIWAAIVISFAVTTASSLLYYASGRWLPDRGRSGAKPHRMAAE
ncbi:MATE family efflux transporter [Gorillibacterium sp. sgz5001074]|uniref:MATE family efflux transporter n=1 Tax=Gorillibacterium sp. sgz5001074 TaxID=3446695 RepID=UPI003F680B9B